MPSLVQQVEVFVRRLLAEQIHDRPFHNIDHTVEVVESCRELVAHYQLDEMPDAVDVLIIAAWFHDTGYTVAPVNHEEESVKIALRFLAPFAVTNNALLAVARLIRATKLSTEPTTLQEKMLCDADLHHLADQDYPKWSSRLREEIQLQGNIVIPVAEWNRQNVQFFKNHHYFTSYAVNFWEAGKANNLALLEQVC